MRSNNFSYLAKQGIVSVWYNRMMSFATFCVLMVSLMLTSIFVLFALNINNLMKSAENMNQISVFAAEDLPEKDYKKIEDDISSKEYVLEVSFKSSQELFEENYRDASDDDKKILDAYQELFGSFYPDTWFVTLSDISKIDEAKIYFASLEGIDEKIKAPDNFLNFLIDIRPTLMILGILILTALIVISLIIVYNAVRGSVYGRRLEIGIMRDFGSTSFFIRLPFFIEGMFIGILSGVASWGLTWIAYDAITSFSKYDTSLAEITKITEIINFSELNLFVLAANCILGVTLSAFGTMLSMGKYLKI